MAIIEYTELVKIIKEHPNYLEKWQMDVPVNQALYIKFSKESMTDLESKVFEARNGLEIVVDFDSEMKVYGIEII